MGLIRFGLCNVHYALYSETDNTYGTPVAWPGAISLALTPKGSSQTVRADNSDYATIDINNGYTGDFGVAALDDEIAVALLGEIKDTLGGLYETTKPKDIRFALLGEIDGNEEPQRFVIYGCKLSRPSSNANTTESDSITPDTPTLNFDSKPHKMTIDDEEVGVPKYTLTRSDTNKETYNKWYDEVLFPTTAAA